MDSIRHSYWRHINNWWVEEQMESKNLYPVKKQGYYVYRQARNNRYLAQRKWAVGYRKSALFYSLEDAVAWIDALPA